VLQWSHKEISVTHDSIAYRQWLDLQHLAPNAGEAAVWLEHVERENRVQRAQLETILLKAKSEGGKEFSRYVFFVQFFFENGEKN
jgi:hypothetical protein